MKFIIYILSSFIIGGFFKWYDLVWFNSSITYFHWVIIAFVSAYFVVISSEKEAVFKSFWQTVMSLIFISTIVAQVMIWLGYVSHYGILK